MNLFVVESTKMATYVRRVQLLVSIFAIIIVKDTKAQIVGGEARKDNGLLQKDRDVLNQGLNPGQNAGGNQLPAGMPNVNAGQPQLNQRINPAGAGINQAGGGVGLNQGGAGIGVNPAGGGLGVNPAGGGLGVNPAGAGIGVNPAAGGFHKPIGLNPQVANAGMKYEAEGSFRKFRLVDHPDCMEDVERICTKNMKRDNFAVLDCLQDRATEEMVQVPVSDKCQHVVWTYKKNLTKDDRFESAQNQLCAKELHEFQDCQALEEGQGKRIPCLIEHMRNITGPCRHFLNKMAKIVFSDYHYVWNFMEHCSADVENFKCGRSETDPEQLHQQGATIECLAKHIKQLSLMCQKQIMRVYELQSEDYHLDRPLYYACRDDRENLCPNVEAGDGKVFECLFDHKFHKAMSDKCRELLRLRQQLMAEDVKVDQTFFSACQLDIQKQHCITGPVEDENWARSAVLLCLENADKRGRKISGECIAEMEELREALMTDYEITPEIVTGCAQEVQHYCKDVGENGKTIHCLMRYVNPKTRKVDQQFSDKCRAAIELLLQEADVEEDFEIDHVLSQACASVIENVCQQAGDGVMDCLLKNLDDESMTDECEDRLLEIQYFVVRDIRLDPDLYENCHEDAVKLCHAADDWADTGKAGVDNSPLIFPCLYRVMKSGEEPTLSKVCRREVKKTMKIRAKRIDLEPEVLEACLLDLAEHCSDLDHYGKNQEIECLQDNYDELHQKCQEFIGNFTEDEDEDIELDPAVSKYCGKMLRKFCEEEPDELECLIDHKNHRDMDEKCAAAVEHHQLVLLKDYRFSHKFKEACKKSVMKHCQGKVTLNDIIECLSESVRNDTLEEKKHRIDEHCRRQLRVEILHRDEDIQLDPELYEACKPDIANFCHGKKTGNAETVECLKDNQPRLSKSCHKMIFRREKIEVVDNMGDYSLYKVCKNMIKEHCSMEMNNGQTDVLDCLKRVKRNRGLDAKCDAYVTKRQLEESKDFRLNPSLMKNCKLDIPKFCKDIHINKDEEMEGQIIHCLKLQYVKKRLSSDCATEIRSLVKESALNIDLDIVLLKACREEIQKHCQREIQAHEDDPRGPGGDAVQECLKRRLIEKKIQAETRCGMEIVRLGDESRVDVGTDLQLSRVCQSDLLHFCREVESGMGQKMSCLLTVFEDSPKELQPRCYALLKERKLLWEFAVNPAGPEGLHELGASVLQSRARTYLIGVIMTIIGVIFLVGISCGRVTKRVPLSMKNK